MLQSSKSQIPGIKTILSVISGKGGVGKTFVAANLALALAKTGKKVGIMDADINCPNMFKVLGITAKIVPTADNKLFPIEKYGVKTVSMAGLVKTDDEPIVWRGPILSKIIQQLLKESLWGELDFLIIDLPTGTSDATITVLQNFCVNACLVVTAPQELSRMDAGRTINALELVKVPVFGIVENMRGEVFGEGGGMRLAEAFRVPFLGSIPLRRQIVQMCDEGTPAIFHMEELEMIFGKISRAILERVVYIEG